MKYKYEFSEENNAVLKKCIEMMESGKSWKAVSLIFRDEAVLQYVAERLVRIGYLWVDGLDPTDKEILVSVNLAKKAHGPGAIGIAAVEIEKQLLNKLESVHHSESVFIMPNKEQLVMDSDFLDGVWLDHADINHTDSQEGWYVLNHDSEPIYMDFHGLELM